MCGIIGVYNNEEASNLAYMGLYAQQHRGQEGAGIVSSDGESLYRYAGKGLVSKVFSNTRTMQYLKGNIAVGHVRYSTAGGDSEDNIGPLWNYNKTVHEILRESYKDNRKIAISHNGNLINTKEILHHLKKGRNWLKKTTDTKAIISLLEEQNEPESIESLTDTLERLKGAFSLIMIIKDKLIAARDEYGIRPLCFGKLGDSYIFASETCVLDLLGADYVRDVEPGEVIVLNNDKFTSKRFGEKKKTRCCVFEHVYFSRPDSNIFGQNVSECRNRMGKQLAEEKPTPTCDIVISVPDSSNTHAMGFAEGQKKKYNQGLIRNHYVGRTFIYPDQRLRDLSVKLKFNVDKGVIRGKKIALIDDSIIRGTTLKKLTKLIKDAGAKEVHIRSSSPPVKFPCFYGMDFPTKKELIANNKSIEETKEELGADSLEYLSLEGLLEATNGKDCDYCTACFSGEYIDYEGD